MMPRGRAAALLAAAALVPGPLPAFAQTAAKLRLGLFPVESAAEGFFAHDTGIFAKAGLDVELEQLGSGIAVASALAGKALDVGFAAVDALANMHTKSLPFVAIAPGAAYVSPATQRYNAIVLPAGSPLRQAADLTGRVLAVDVLHGFQYTAARTWIDKHGGDSGAVKFIEIPTSAKVATLNTGRADAIFLTEPQLSVASATHRVLAYGMDDIAKDFLIGAWFCTKDWAAEHADLVARFAAAMRETAVWANQNPAKSGEILATYAKIDPAVVARMARLRYAEQLVAAQMQPLIDAAAKYDGFPTFPAQQLIAAR